MLRSLGGFGLWLLGPTTPNESRPGSPRPPSSSSSQPTPERCGLFIFGNKRPPGDYDIDIVAVHGLGGHWEDTWTDGNGKLWLRDFLPSQLPKARIMSFGYNSETVFSNAVTDIRDEALILLTRLQGQRRDERTRPILFICHSLGGIVMKKALVLANERLGIYEDLLNSVQGCVFFGVPHRGSTSAYWGALAARITKIVQLGTNTNTNFIDALKKNSGLLDEISQQFVERAAQLRIKTFYETNTLSSFLIVDRDSAQLNLPNEVAVGIPDADHRTICKFGNASSQKYSLVEDAIRDLSDSASSTKPLSKEEIEKIKMCLQYLYTSNYNSHQQRVPPPTPGTCSWFLRHNMYTTWSKKQGSSLLWISAYPGCGKSVLSSFLVNKFREPDTALPGTVCFFFFKDDNEEQKDATSALRALLHQLFKANNSLINHAMPEIKSKGQKFTDELDTLWRIFTSAATDPRSGDVICVIDALDECEQSTRKILIDYLVRFYSDCEDPSGSKGRLKIIVTSRPYRKIEDGFRDLPEARLKGENETDVISTDIGNVIIAKVEDLGRMRNLSPDVQKNLNHKLIERADQTFLWVSLILQLLLDAPEASEKEFNKIIDNLPNDLDAVYNKILKNSRNLPNTIKILHIIVAAARPLTLDEMNIALAIEAHHTSIKDLEPNLVPSIESTIKELCGLFVRVIDSKVYLVHQTAKEFLTNDSRLGTNVPRTGTWKHTLHFVESNFIIAGICISYILFTNFEINPLVIGSRYTHSKDMNLYTSKHAFLDYAAKHWAVHFREAQTWQGTNLLEPALKVCNTGSKIFSTWFQVYWTTVSTDNECPQSFTDLMVASYFGHETVVQLLLERGTNVNEHSYDDGGALNTAALGRQRGTVEVLLNSGANFYAFGHEYTDIRQVRKPFQHQMAEAMTNSQLILRYRE